MKLKKDNRATIRINSKIKEEIKRKGSSVQKIIDKYIEENFEISEKIKRIEK